LKKSTMHTPPSWAPPLPGSHARKEGLPYNTMHVENR
jgi:hypothetical protein